MDHNPIGYTSNQPAYDGLVQVSGTLSSSFVPAIAFSREPEHTFAGISNTFTNLNSLIYETIYSGSNLLSSSRANVDGQEPPDNQTSEIGRYQNTALATLPVSSTLNALLLHRNGPYQHPAWKQIRTGDHPIARFKRKKNQLDTMKNVLLEQSEIRKSDFFYSNPYTGETANEHRPKYNRIIEQHTVSPVSNKYKPMEHTVVLPMSPDPVTIIHTYGNNITYMPTDKLDLLLDTENNVPAQAYNRFADQSSNG